MMSIHFTPLIDDNMLMAIGIIIAALASLSFIFLRKGMIWRSLCALAFLLYLAGPSLIEEQREGVKDVAAIVVDLSQSQSFAARPERTEEALAYIQDTLNGRDDLELRIVESTDHAQDTKLFEALDQALADVPLDQRAGAIFISDGQIHDVPDNEARRSEYGPVHLLLTGDHDERDRRIKILEAPAYGIIGQQVDIRYRIEDTDATSDDYATLNMRYNNRNEMPDLIPVNSDQSLTVTIEHAGQNVVDLNVPGMEGELTLSNNRVPLIINGVRDRLKVLLVSGQPHAGGRTWRNLLTADPGVDLVHFTILRDPSKLDNTPQRELALIAFPFRELFEIKLNDFDLIIFDRYRLNQILPLYYFANIAKYVRSGGALLEASGPEFTGERSIYTTPLQDVLPARPITDVIKQPYKPALTDIGLRHPVTQNLQSDNGAGWGEWLQQIPVNPARGDVLMKGIGELPLLILDRVGKGRVAQLASDNIWLWSRGYEGGGPQALLLRRLAHWLMKEPELEEDALNVSLDNGQLLIRKRSLDLSPTSVKVTLPDGTNKTILLTPSDENDLAGKIDAPQAGVYAVSDGDQERFAISGTLNPLEMRNILSSDEPLSSVIEQTKGNALWLADTAKPQIKRIEKGRHYGGNNWIGLRKNNSYNVTGVTQRPLLVPLLAVLFLVTSLIACWWMEGRRA
jgi:uncharacterized membrane protein